MTRLLNTISLTVFLTSFADTPIAAAAVLDKSATIEGMTVHYKVVVPPNFDPSKEYPTVLAFPPGDQSMFLVNATLDGNYRGEAEKRGYIVIEPAAPEGKFFHRDGARIFPAFLTKLLADYKVAGGKFHVAGHSNGGRSAFTTAANYPQYFWSVTGFPGYIDNPTPKQMEALGTMCIHMFVGELDQGWPDWTREQAAKFRAAGFNVTYSVERGEQHVIRGLEFEGAARYFDQFDAARQGHCAKQ